MKICSKCKETKPLTSEFWPKRASSKDGFYYYCKVCACEHSKKSKVKNPGYQREWREANPGYDREWREANPGRNSEAGRRQTMIHPNQAPKWRDKEEILEYYGIARALCDLGRDMVVDHEIPLDHPQVCGLHVHNNLQIISRFENGQKGNSYAIE